jgi:O-antigen/teichoic acid export membrane protein
LGLYKSLFKQTAIYGLATVLPRIFSFLLVPLYTKMLKTGEYGEVSIIFSWLVVFNVILAYGMETSFFRFYNSHEDKRAVIGTSTISVFWTTIIFLIGALLSRNTLANLLGIDAEYITYTIWILVLDALVIIPFSKLRAYQRPVIYALIKIGNVVINLGLNVFFLVYLPKIASTHPDSFMASLYVENFQIGYIFVANIIASLLTLIVLSPNYFHIQWHFDAKLWRQMLRYGFPILIAGLAFAINEHFDKILLEKLHISKAEIGAYAACYKIGLFMVLFRTAYTLGIEPFFFSYAKNENAPQTYADITKYFVIFGSVISLSVIVFADVLKLVLIPNETYWSAMKVVPLIVLANFFLGIYTNLSVWYKLTDQTKMGAYISIVGAIVTLTLNFLLIEKFSYMGSAIATIAAYGSMMTISYYLGNRYYPIPYDKNKIGFYLGLSVLFSFVYYYGFRENYFVGIALLVLYLYFVYRFEKNVLLRLLKK